MINLFAILIASAQAPAPMFRAGKSGQAEALADLSSGKPVRLYARTIGGERVEGELPGLLNCDTERGEIPTKMFDRLMDLPAADFSEGVGYTGDQIRAMHPAVLFARAYNVTMFTMRRSEVLQICPAALRDSRPR